VKYTVSDFVFERVPLFRRAVITADRIDNTCEPHELLQALAKQQDHAHLSLPQSAEVVAVWQEAFASLGMSPEVRPSIVNLMNRVKSGTQLKFISPLVCISNLISLRFFLPSGPMDRDRLVGDLKLLPAIGDEKFLAIGADRPKSVPRGEPILRDEETGAVICRGWNSRGSVVGMVAIGL
jgi:DNA/RNA-binding domain of Phe-tRNA-synthetase-like protein